MGAKKSAGSTPLTLIKGSSNSKRPGIHAKCRASKLKSSKIYKKRYAGQGR